MKIIVISLFPDMFDAVTGYGVSGRAVDKGLVALEVINPRDFTEDRHSTVDAKPYGGGPGMVMMIEPLRRAIAEAKKRLGQEAKVVYLSPQGQVLQHKIVSSFAGNGNLILLAGRYEGIDERLLELDVDEEISIGDYVLSGGELPAMVLIDAIARLLPGALGDQQSAQQDSFVDGLLECPQYTRPENYEGKTVPDVLLSGNHERIRQWRLQQSLLRTQARRPDLLQERQLTDEEQQLLTSSETN